jgi:hypothetical protein
MSIISQTARKLLVDFCYTAANFTGTGPISHACYNKGARFASDVAAEVLSHAADQAIRRGKIIELDVTFEGFLSSGPTYYSDVGGTMKPKLQAIIDKCERNKVRVSRHLEEGSYFGHGPMLSLKFTPFGCHA